jgi:SAM-dependent methyltransferase
MMDQRQMRSGVKDVLIRNTKEWYGPGAFSNDKKIEREIAPTVERISTILNLISPLAAQAKERGLPAKGLEIGLGYGELALSLAHLFPEYKWEGVEYPGREYMRTGAYEERFRKYGVNVHLCDITSQALPFEDNSFSFVTLSEVIEHLPPNKVIFILSEIRRVLHSGGWLVASSPNLVAFLNRLKIILGKGIFEAPVSIAKYGNTFGHIRLYTAGEFSGLCAMCGLKEAKVFHKSIFTRYPQNRSFVKNAFYWIVSITEAVTAPFGNRLSDTWFAVMRKN